MSAWRKITVGDRVYRWRFGRVFVMVRDDSTGRVVFKMRVAEATGISPDTFERGQRKRTSDGMITPNMIASAIIRWNKSV